MYGHVRGLFLSESMCKLVCILTSDTDVWCGSSDPALLVCTGVWGLLSFIVLIIYLRWQGEPPASNAKPQVKH
jgi:hypothetical protein